MRPNHAEQSRVLRRKAVVQETDFGVATDAGGRLCRQVVGDHAAVLQLFVDRQRLVRRIAIELFAEQSPTDFELGDGQVTLPGAGKKPHELAVGIFMPWLELDQPLGGPRSICPGRTPHCGADQAFERLDEPRVVGLAMQQQPHLEIRSAGEAESGQKLALVQVGGGPQRVCVATVTGGVSSELKVCTSDVKCRSGRRADNVPGREETRRELLSQVLPVRY